VTLTGHITAYYALPIVSFTSNTTTGIDPLTIEFTDSSTNSPTSWYWYFGDGGTSTEKNPVYEYTDAGTYSVSLTATNDAGSNETTETDYITVTAVTSPVVSFTSDVTTGRSPLTVQFTDTSLHTPTSWQWSFGDGTSSTDQNPEHTYTSTGSYTVLLTAANVGGSRTRTVNDYIVVSDPAATTLPTAVPSHLATTIAPVDSSTTFDSVTMAANQTTAGSGESSGLLPLIVVGFVILVCAGIVIVRRTPPRGPGRSRRREL
jgi:PKD repeat protein